MPDKILFIASTFSHLLNFHQPYMQAFRDRGWEVHVAAGRVEHPIPQAAKQVHLPFQKSMTAPANFQAASQLRKLIQQEEYQIISVHTALAAFFARLAVKGMKNRPFVLNVVHGYLFDGNTSAAKRTILLAAEQLTAHETDLLAVMNQWDLQFAEAKHLGREVAYIPGMGVDYRRLDRCTRADGMALRATLGIPEDAVVMLYPAEFSARKNQSALLQAMPKLPKQAVLVLPGQGVLLEDCKQQAQDLHIADRVYFPGQIGDMAPWYAAADLAASSSRSEGLPFNIAEAMHCGLPVAASTVKGHTDLVVPGETGLLYPYGDEAALVQALTQLIQDPSLRQRMGDAGRVRAEQFGLDAVYPQVMALYDRALAAIGTPVSTQS